jgi:hypothetical protein
VATAETDMKNPLESLSSTVIIGFVLVVVLVVLVKAIN